MLGLVLLLIASAGGGLASQTPPSRPAGQEVYNGHELWGALREGVDDIILSSRVPYRLEPDFDSVVVARDVTIRGLAAADAQLDLNYVRHKIHLLPGVTLTLANLTYLHPCRGLFLALDIISSSPQAVVNSTDAVVLADVCIPHAWQRRQPPPPPPGFEHCSQAVENVDYGNCPPALSRYCDVKQHKAGWRTPQAYAWRPVVDMYDSAGGSYVLVAQRTHFFCRMVIPLDCPNKHSPVKCADMLLEQEAAAAKRVAWLKSAVFTALAMVGAAALLVWRHLHSKHVRQIQGLDDAGAVASRARSHLLPRQPHTPQTPQQQQKQRGPEQKPMQLLHSDRLSASVRHVDTHSDRLSASVRHVDTQPAEALPQQPGKQQPQHQHAQGASPQRQQQQRQDQKLQPHVPHAKPLSQLQIQQQLLALNAQALQRDRDQLLRLRQQPGQQQQRGGAHEPHQPGQQQRLALLQQNRAALMEAGGGRSVSLQLRHAPGLAHGAADVVCWSDSQLAGFGARPLEGGFSSDPGVRDALERSFELRAGGFGAGGVAPDFEAVGGGSSIGAGFEGQYARPPGSGIGSSGAGSSGRGSSSLIVTYDSDSPHERISGGQLPGHRRLSSLGGPSSSSQRTPTEGSFDTRLPNAVGAAGAFGAWPRGTGAAGIVSIEGSFDGRLLPGLANPEPHDPRFNSAGTRGGRFGDVAFVVGDGAAGLGRHGWGAANEVVAGLAGAGVAGGGSAGTLGPLVVPEPAGSPLGLGGLDSRGRQLEDSAKEAGQEAARKAQGSGLVEGLVLGRVIGVGSFGKVYLGTWHGDLVAVKVLEVSAADAPRAVSEVQLAVRMRHPNLVTGLHHALLDAAPPGKQDDVCQVLLVQEYCDLGPLSASTRASSARTMGHASLGMAARQSGSSIGTTSTSLSVVHDVLPVLRRLCDVAKGMAHLHSQRIVHGDLKQDNVLLKRDDDAPDGIIAKVGDFGLSRALGDETHMSTRNFGTITHMAPEVLQHGHISTGADVYSFGMMAWELLHGGVRAYAGMIAPRVLHDVIYASMRPEFAPGAPLPLKRLVEECWATEVAARPPFSAILPRLEAMLAEEEGIESRRTSSLDAWAESF